MNENDLYKEIKYRKESEIDKAFDYINKLDNEIKDLEQQVLLKENKINVNKSIFHKFNLFLKKKKKINLYNDTVKITRTTLKRKSYKKDGYVFNIYVTKNYKNTDNKTIFAYEFFSNILYNDLQCKNQFYKQFYDEPSAKDYFNQMQGVFKNLTRRDLIEKLFNEKLNKIEELKVKIK